MRNSDRWVTPAVIVTLLIGGTVCVLATIAAVTWLTARGIDPDPVLKLPGLVLTAVASLVSMVVTLATRVTVSKTEKNTGLLAGKTHELAGAVYEVADALPRPVAAPRHAYEDTVFAHGAAPAPRGS